MPRYVAFLRGVSPLNARMPELKRCFERAGFTGVKTFLSSGNVAFDARTSQDASLERKIEAAMTKDLDRSFYTIVRTVDELNRILAADPFPKFRLKAGTKRVVTFLRGPAKPTSPLPIRRDGAAVLEAIGREAYSAYEPGPKGPVFMTLIEKAFGRDVTTRTWDTLKKVVR